MAKRRRMTKAHRIKMYTASIASKKTPPALKKGLRKALAKLLILCAIATAPMMLHGCVARVPASPTVPGRAAKPIENVLAWNAALAQSNLTVANDVIAAQNAAFISVDAANTILTAQSRIADADRQLTILLQNLGNDLASNPNAKISAAQVEQLIALIQGAANGLIGSGDLGIKNAGTEKSAKDALTAIATLANQIITTLRTENLLS